MFQSRLQFEECYEKHTSYTVWSLRTQTYFRLSLLSAEKWSDSRKYVCVRRLHCMSVPCKINGNLTELMSFFTGSDVHGLSAWQVALGCNKSRIFPTISVTELRGGAVYLNRKWVLENLTFRLLVRMLYRWATGDSWEPSELVIWWP